MNVRGPGVPQGRAKRARDAHMTPPANGSKPEASQEGGVITPPSQERKAKWPLLIIGFGLLLTAVWAALLLWAGVAVFGEFVSAVTAADPVPLDELLPEPRPSQPGRDIVWPR
jgi:hypothetical protein